MAAAVRTDSKGKRERERGGGEHGVVDQSKQRKTSSPRTGFWGSAAN